jgi:hypothetical protein
MKGDVTTTYRIVASGHEGACRLPLSGPVSTLPLFNVALVVHSVYGFKIGIRIWMHTNLVYMRFCTSKWAFLILPFVVVAAAWQASPVLYEGLGESLIFLAAAIFIDVSIQQYDSIPGRILNSLQLATRPAGALEPTRFTFGSRSFY